MKAYALNDPRHPAPEHMLGGSSRSRGGSACNPNHGTVLGQEEWAARAVASPVGREWGCLFDGSVRGRGSAQSGSRSAFGSRYRCASAVTQSSRSRDAYPRG